MKETVMSETALSERPPTDAEAKEAATVARLLGSVFDEEGLPFSVHSNGDQTTVKVSPAIGQLVLDVLGHIARREMVTLVPYGAQLSTKEAADILNVSRPHLVKLLENGDIPFHMVGSHRRVQAEDVLTFKAGRDLKRSKSLSKLQQLGQEFDKA